MPNTEIFDQLQDFFGRRVCIEALKPLSVGSTIAVHVPERESFTLSKSKEGPVLTAGAPSKPDLSFWLSEAGIPAILEDRSETVGDVGICLLRRMVADEKEGRMSAKVHLGLFDLYRRGYFSVLALGGPQVMSFLAGKGLTGMGKIKDAIGKIRESK